MTALVFADRRIGLFGGGLVAVGHGVVRHGMVHVHGRLHFAVGMRELAAQQGNGRERLHGQGQHHEDQQEAFQAGMHQGSLAKSRIVTK